MRIGKRRILTVAVLGLVAILTTEVLARAGLGLGDPPLYQTDPEIEYLLKPNQRVKRFGHRYVVNRFGMRSEDFEPKKGASGERRVLVFGDSVVNGGAQVDQGRLATEQLRVRLGQTGQVATVGNVAAFSWGPGNWLAYARRFGFLDADTAIIVVNGADYGDVPTFAPLRPDTHPSQPPLSALVEGATRYLPAYLGLDQSSGPVRESTDADRAASLRDLAELIVMAKRAGVQVRLVQHYERDELDGAGLPAGLQAFSRLCEQYEVPVVSMRDAERRSRDVAYLDDIHLSPEGQDLLADALLAAANLPAGGRNVAAFGLRH
jgi:hypothetical protein